MCEIFEAYAKEVHHELMEINEKQKQEFESINEKQKQEYEAINIKQKQEYEEKIVTLMLSMGTYDMNEIRKYSTLNQDEIKAIADRFNIGLIIP